MSNGDPFDSDKPRGKSNAKRMGRYDGSYTPTEQRLKDSLMKQFCRDEGPPPSKAYLNAPCWCECGRLKAEGRDECAKCAAVFDDVERRPGTAVVTIQASGHQCVERALPPEFEGHWAPASEGWADASSDANPAEGFVRAVDMLKGGG